MSTYRYSIHLYCDRTGDPLQYLGEAHRGPRSVLLKEKWMATVIMDAGTWCFWFSMGYPKLWLLCNGKSHL